MCFPIVYNVSRLRKAHLFMHCLLSLLYCLRVGRPRVRGAGSGIGTQWENDE